MHTLQSVAPRHELREYVRAYAQRNTGATDAVLEQRVPASLEQVLEFEFGTPPTVHYRNGTSEPAHRIAIVGARSSPSASLRLAGGVESFAIFLQPAALRLLFGLSADHLADQSYSAPDVLGPQIETLWSTLAEAPTFEDRVRLAEFSLLRRMPSLSDRTAITSVAMVTFRRHGRIQVDEMAAHSSLSVRQFERAFAREIGIPPKLFARIARFQGALDAKVIAPTRSWLEIAHDSGYYDQMHLVHDFESLGGVTPTRFLSQLGDARPPALADSR